MNTAHILTDNGRTNKLNILIQQVNIAIMKAAADGKNVCIVDIQDEVFLKPLQEAFAQYKIEQERADTRFRFTWGYQPE